MINIYALLPCNSSSGKPLSNPGRGHNSHFAREIVSAEFRARDAKALDQVDFTDRQPGKLLSRQSQDQRLTDFDPATYPIIALHFFGVEPLRPVGQIAAEVVADLQFRRQVERLHRLGPRVTAELLAEIGAERSIMTGIDQKIEKYINIEPAALEAAGGNKFPPLPIHEVRS